MNPRIKRAFILITATLMVMISSCKKHMLNGSINLKSINVAVVQLPNAVQDTGMLNFKITIIPSAVKQAEQGLGDKLWYHADSCFYLMAAGKKIDPVLVQPIANGVRGAYEYLAEFEEKEPQNAVMIFNDTYITHQKLTINLK